MKSYLPLQQLYSKMKASLLERQRKYEKCRRKLHKYFCRHLQRQTSDDCRVFFSLPRLASASKCPDQHHTLPRCWKLTPAAWCHHIRHKLLVPVGKHHKIHLLVYHISDFRPLVVVCFELQAKVSSMIYCCKTSENKNIFYKSTSSKKSTVVVSDVM